jgi:pimeloyl-ACP methyl ester carboxylesterase
VQDLQIPITGGALNVWYRAPHQGASTALLVHGLTGNSRWWTRVIEYLPHVMGVISMDVRGRGGSLDAPPPFDLRTIANDIKTCLDHLEVDQAVVAGYSMGGWIVSLFGVDHPRRCQRLVLVDGGLTVPSDPSLDADEIIRAVVGPALARLDIDFDSIESYEKYWMDHPALSDYWEPEMGLILTHELGATELGYRSRANADAIAVAGREITVDEEISSAPLALEVPTELIVVERGTLDQPGGMIPLETAQAAAGANPQLKITFVADVNHYTLVLGKGAPVVAAAIVG